MREDRKTVIKPIIHQIISLLSCPDDGSNLKLERNILSCISCNREFLIKENIIDLRSKKKATITKLGEIEQIYDSYYDSLITKGEPDKYGSFGLHSKSISEGFVNETFLYLKNFFKKSSIICDIGAGTGDYSVNLAKNCHIMLHCDLDLKGITISQAKAKSKGINNIFFLLCDYFKLPLNNKSIDLAYSIDVIENGKDHDTKLMNEISRVVKNNGTLLLDCHSKERSKLTGIVPNPASVYSKKEILDFVNRYPIKVLDIIGTGYVPQIKMWSKFEYQIFNSISKILRFPPGRWILACKII